MNNPPPKNKRRCELSPQGRFQTVLGVGFLCLAWMEHLSPSTHSGKWGWLEKLIIEHLGNNGLLVALMFVGVVLILSAAFEMIDKLKGATQ